MREKSYLRIVSEDSRIRARFKTEKGEVKEFMIQMEVRYEGKWVPVVRFDTAHGYAHKDTFYRGVRQKKEELVFGTFNESFTFAQLDLSRNWKNYKKAFLKERGDNG